MVGRSNYFESTLCLKTINKSFGFCIKDLRNLSWDLHAVDWDWKLPEAICNDF